MSALAHMRRYLLPLAIVVAIVAIAVPTCRMVGCDMDDMGAMTVGSHTMPLASAMCLGQWELSSSPAGTVPTGGSPLSISIFAALAAAVILLTPQTSVRRVFAYVGDPPPPPHDPLGERFRV